MNRLDISASIGNLRESLVAGFGVYHFKQITTTTYQAHLEPSVQFDLTLTTQRFGPAVNFLKIDQVLWRMHPEVRCRVRLSCHVLLETSQGVVCLARIVVVVLGLNHIDEILGHSNGEL